MSKIIQFNENKSKILNIFDGSRSAAISVIKSDNLQNDEPTIKKMLKQITDTITKSTNRDTLTYGYYFLKLSELIDDDGRFYGEVNGNIERYIHDGGFKLRNVDISPYVILLKEYLKTHELPQEITLNKGTKTKLFKFDKNKKLVKVYNSYQEASIEADRRTIKKNIESKSLYNDHFWSFNEIFE